MSAELTAASGLWAQANPAKKSWKYKDSAKPNATGISGMSIKEKDAGTNEYDVKITGKYANLDPLAAPLGAGDGLTVVIQIENAGVGECVSGTLTTCVGKGAKDLCTP